MLVREAMAKTIRTAGPSDTVQQVAELMRAEDTGFVPVAEQGRLLGVVTDRDLVVGCLAEGHRDPLAEQVSHCMHQPVVTIRPEDELEEAARLMSQNHVRRLAVLDGDKLVGILSHGNLVQATRGEEPAATATVGVTEGA